MATVLLYSNTLKATFSVVLLFWSGAPDVLQVRRFPSLFTVLTEQQTQRGVPSYVINSAC